MTIRPPKTKQTHSVLLDVIYQLAPFCQSDPKDQRLDAPRDINLKETAKIMVTHFRAKGLEAEIRAITGKTLHGSVTLTPLINFVLYVNGYIGFEDLKEIWEKGIQETDAYGFALDGSDELLMCFAAGQSRIHEAFVSGEYKTADREVKLPDDESKLAAINTLLDSADLPPFNVLVNRLDSFDEVKKGLESQIKGHEKTCDTLSKDLERIQGVVKDLQMEGGSTARKEVNYDSDGTIPSGKMVIKKASEVFGVKLPVDLNVETYEWDGPHPDVPEVDPHYIFRPDLLVRVLYSLLTKQNAWVQGHTGSGKTTLIEQVCALLKKPFVRVNLDSEISRFDLVGKDVLKTEYKEETKETMTVSEFLEGVLPRALKMPCVLCMDEIDFIRPDVAYVLQSITEGKGMRLNEDGGRWIHPHPEFNICATANTVGQGDEFGMYQGARPQSMAFIDRFPVFIKVPYMKDVEREDLIKRHYPAMSMDQIKRINQYVEEHIYAFTKGDVIQPITPRGMLAIARAATILGDEKAALEMTVLDKANQEDAATLLGISSRIFA